MDSTVFGLFGLLRRLLLGVFGAHLGEGLLTEEILIQGQTTLLWCWFCHLDDACEVVVVAMGCACAEVSFEVLETRRR